MQCTRHRSAAESVRSDAVEAWQRGRQPVGARLVGQRRRRVRGTYGGNGSKRRPEVTGLARIESRVMDILRAVIRCVRRSSEATTRGRRSRDSAASPGATIDRLLSERVQIDPWTSPRAGQLPCAACGFAVSREGVSGEDIEHLQVAGTGRSLSQPNLAATRCKTCSMIRASALALLGGHPDVRARIGSPDIAPHRLESALNALDVLGISDAPTVDRLTSTRSDIMRLIDAQTISGGTARWAVMARSQTFTRGASKRAASARWDHVAPEHRQVLRNAAAGLLARRAEQPVDVLCPSDDGRPAGCLLAASAQHRRSKRTPTACGR